MRLLIFILFCHSAFSACHAVGPASAGTGDGSSWTNRMILPATVTRGDTYYLMDGSYGSYTFNTTGTSATTIQKATTADQGQNCTPSIAGGWNAGTMGSAAAIFTQWSEGASSGGNYTLNGKFGGFSNTLLPANSSFGICISGSANCNSSNFSTTTCVAGTLSRCTGIDSNGNGFVTVTFSYIEIQGVGATSANNSNSARQDSLVYYGGSSGLTLDHMFLHDSSCDMTQAYGSTNLTVQYSFFYKNYGAGTCHGQGTWMGNTHSGGTWRYNTFRTIEGTAIFTAATAGGGTALSNFSVYGNTIYYGGTGDKSDYQCLGNGIISCVNTGVTCGSVVFYNNTIVAFPAAGNAGEGGGNCGASAAGFYSDGSASWSGLTAENNIWYGNDCSSTPAAAISTVTEDYNSFLNNNGNAGTGTHDLTNGSASNPFTTWTGTGNLDARLVADSSNVNNWLSLSSPYNTDPNATIRTTDRGAYQFVQGGGGGGGAAISGGVYIGGATVVR